MAKKAAKKAEPQGEYGIRDLVWVDPKTLDSNPKNWRKHPHRQRQALNASLAHNGWAGACLYNELTGKLLDGHMRKEEAIKRGDNVVPVLVGRWTEEQENHILATLDPLAAMAETQAEALAALTENVNSHLQSFKDKASQQTKDILSKLNADLDSFATQVASGEAPSVLLSRSRDRKEYDRNRSIKAEKKSEQQGVTQTEFVDDVVFSSTNSFGIPDLRGDVLCTEPPTSIWDRSPDSVTPDAYYCYSAGPSTIPDAKTRAGGFLGFFTEDFRFETCWNDTPAFTKWLLTQDFKGALAPDFSTWADWPLAVRLHQLYKSRWVARYWQEANIPIIPIVQSLGLTDFDEDAPDDETLSATLCLHSLPERVPVLATEARNSQGEEGYWTNWVSLHKLVLSIVEPQYLVIYGGLETAKFWLARLLATNKRRSTKSDNHYKLGRTDLILLSSFIGRRRKGGDHK